MGTCCMLSNSRCHDSDILPCCMQLEDSMRLVMYQLDCIKSSNEKLLARVDKLEGMITTSPCYKGPSPRSKSVPLASFSDI